MRTHKVRLYIRIRLADGRHFYADPVWNRNRTLRSGYAMLDGQPTSHQGGVFYLRYLRGGKRVWHSVGQDADRAITALRNKEHDLQSEALGRAVPITIPPPPPKVSLDEAVVKYLAEVEKFKAPKTISACKNMLTVFKERFPDRSIVSVTREDLLNHMSHLKDAGLSDRTIYNHIERIGTLLRANGISGLLGTNDKPKYDEKVVEAYDSDQLAKLFTAANPEERLLFEFFLGTGFREQEVMFTSWKNINFKSKLISVKSKPDDGFRVKDKEERSVPVPDSLIASLASRRSGSTSQWIFPGPTGEPNGHFLRMLQTLALRSGLNCGECESKGGQSCSSNPICSNWGLHKFRKTFATMHSEAGVPTPTIQAWLGHSDLSTTLRYLVVADLRSERTRSQVNASFAMLAAGGAA